MDQLNLPWEALTTRFILFLAQPLPPTIDLWRLIAEAEPEVDENRPREGLRRQIGPLGDRILEVSISAVRVDIALVPSVELHVGGGFGATLGEFESAMNALHGPLLRVLANFPAIFSRLAFNGGALTRTGSVDESYRVLAQLCRSVEVRPEMRDFQFRVNWQKQSGRPGVGYYNRLTTFSALSVMAEFATSPSAPRSALQNHYALMDLDVNTPADRRGAFAPEAIGTIFEDLLALVRQNLMFGEVRG